MREAPPQLFRRHRRERDAAGFGVIGGHDAACAGVAEEDESLAARSLAAHVKLGGTHQLLWLRGPPDAMVLEEGIDHAVFARQCSRVRACRLLTAGGATSLERNNRYIATPCLGRGSGERRWVLDCLHIQEDQAYALIVHHGAR